MTRPLVCSKLNCGICHVTWYIVVVLFFLILGTDNESLEQNFSDLCSCFVKLSIEPHTYIHTHSHAHTQTQTDTETHLTKTHWRTICWTDVMQGAKGKNRLQVTKECLDLAWSLQPEQVRPHASPSCTACPKCSSMHARLCKRHTI